MISKLISLKNHSGFKKYFKNTSLLYTEKILRMAVGLSIGVWIARYLGPVQYGLFSYVTSYVGLFSVFTTLGLDSIIVRELVDNGEKRDVLLGTAFFLKLTGAFLVLIILAVTVYFSSNEPNTNRLVFIIASATIFQSLNVIDFFFQSMVLSKYVVLINTISLFITSLIKVVLVLNDATLISFAWVIVIDNFLVALGYIYIYNTNKFFIKKWQYNIVLAKKLVKNSLPLIFSGFAVSIYMKIDQVMIQNILDNKATGIYAVAVRLTEMWLFITILMRRSLFPAILNAKKVSEKLYYSRIIKMYQILILIALIIAVFVSILSHELVLYTYGIEYIKSADILYIYIWSNIFVYLNNSSWSWFITENLQKVAAIRLIIGAVINIILNLLFINKYGLQGAAYATLISYSIASYFGNLFSRRTWVHFKLQTMAAINIFNVRSYYQ
jgi:O-antigen/teichoic acid export membrane protein